MHPTHKTVAKANSLATLFTLLAIFSCMVIWESGRCRFDVKASIIIIFNVHMTPIIGGGNSMTAVPLLKVLGKARSTDSALCKYLLF